MTGQSADPGGNDLEIAVYAEGRNATGAPRLFPSAEVTGVLLADNWQIADSDGLETTGTSDEGTLEHYWTYQWFRVEDGTDTPVGTNSAKYQPAAADAGHRIKVRVSYTDGAGHRESRTSDSFGPIAMPPTPDDPPKRVSNTGQSNSSTASITQQYAQGFRLGDHGQGYRIDGVEIELGAATTALRVSLWVGAPDATKHHGQADYRVFDFVNPAAMSAGTNTFNAPPGAFAYQNVNYWIVLSDFGDSISLKETNSNSEDSGSESGAVIFNNARTRDLGSTGRWGNSASRSNVLRMSVLGSQWDRGMLAANYSQDPKTGSLDQEIISVGDLISVKLDLGSADRYLVRGFSWLADNGTTLGGGFKNPMTLWENSTDDKNPGDELLTMFKTRHYAGINSFTAPQGSTVEGDADYLVGFDSRDGAGFEREGAVFVRTFAPEAAGDDSPTAPGVSLGTGIGDGAWPGGYPYMAVLGEPLDAMVQNLGQTDDGYAKLSGRSFTNSFVYQGFTTGSDTHGYRLQGIGVNIKGSGGNRPDGPSSVQVSVHTDSSGTAGEKLFDLISPNKFAVGHTFFEAPPASYLKPNTSYVMLWRFVKGTEHRLRTTSTNAEDSGAASGAGMTDTHYSGTSRNSMTQASGGKELEIAIYTETLDEATIPADSGATVSTKTVEVAEGGTATYTLVLDAEPSADVIISVTGGGDVSVSPTSVTFTSSNWNSAKTITVTAAEDHDAVDDTQTITHAVSSSSDTDYAGLSIDSVSVTVNDNDTPGVIVSTETLSVVEGSSGTYTVELDAQPTANVTVTVTGGGDVSVSPTSLTFTPSNWNTKRTVTVSAAEDTDTVNDTRTVTHAIATGSAPEYAGLAVQSLAVTVSDNDAPGVSVSRSTLRVDEGSSGTYTVRLTAQPAANVIITITAGGDVTVQPTQLTFSSSTWNTRQTVIVTAAEDTDNADDSQTVTHQVATGSAPEYLNLAVDSLAVTILDNDARQVTATFERSSASRQEGNSIPVAVLLSHSPRRQITLPLITARGPGLTTGDFSVVPPSVTFAPGTQRATFTVTFADDTLIEQDKKLTLSFGTLPDLVSAGHRPQLVITLTDNDGPPTAPRNLRIAVIGDVTRFSWSPVQNDSPVTSYELRWRKTNGGSFNDWQNVALATSPPTWKRRPHTPSRCGAPTHTAPAPGPP